MIKNNQDDIVFLYRDDNKLDLLGFTRINSG